MGLKSHPYAFKEHETSYSDIIADPLKATSSPFPTAKNSKTFG